MKVTRSGLSQNAAISSVKLFVDDLQVGTSQSLNSSNQAVFNNISIEIPANTTKTVDLAATMAKNATYNGNIIVLGIASADDITTTANVSGSFPINGNAMTISSSVTIGTATLYNGSSGTRNTSDLTVDTDATDVRFTQVKITAGSAEGLKITQVTAIKNGTASASDVKDIKLVNDTTAETVGTVDSLDSNGRAVFSGLNIEVGKGNSVELSILASMNNSGAGRTIAFDLHDGTAYTIRIVGNVYGFGITPTRNNFCSSTGTCTTQTINQGYLTVQKSSKTPATGKVALGGSGVTLAAFDFKAAGEAINVSSMQIKVDTSGGLGTGQPSDFTNIGLYTEDGSLVTGPQDATTTTAGGNQTLTFTTAYTVPVGTTTYYVKANISSSALADEAVQISLPASSISAKGASSGKTTYTTSSGSTVPPTGVVSGNIMTLQGPALTVITAASPIAGNLVVNAQDATFANIDLDASSSGEDIKVTTIMVQDTLGSGTDYSGINNLELWDGTTKLETSNSTATNGATTTFTLLTPLKVSKASTKRLVLKADIKSTTGTSHTFNVDGTNATVTALGWTTGASFTVSYSGNGQAQTIQSSGLLTVTKSADMPASAQLVSASTGNEVMKYKFSASYEPVDVTTFSVYAGDNTQAGSTTTLGNIAKVYVYVNGTLIGNTSGYSLGSDGRTTVVLDSGTFVVPKDGNSTLTIKVDIPSKDQVTTSASANFQIGIEAATTNGTVKNKDNTWGDTGADNDYWIVATGQSSGQTISKDTINQLGSDSATNNIVYGSNGFSIHKGILTVSLNSSSPSGSQTAGAGKEVIRIDLTATGDDITINEIEFTKGGTATVTGTGAAYIKSVDNNITYATLASGTAWLNGTFSVGDSSNSTTFSTTLEIAAGSTKTVKVVGDTTGATTNETLQYSVAAPASSYKTVAGVEYEDSSGTDIDLATTKNLPLSGGSLSY